jgi:hypothetical protein|tara:strand:+ start:129 stop:491 length:363 start_codon:yes stop_codon:yes gene_type:complete
VETQRALARSVFCSPFNQLNAKVDTMLKAHNLGDDYFKVTFNAELVGWVELRTDGIWYATIKGLGRDEIVVGCKSFHEGLFVFNDYNWKRLIGPRVDSMFHSKYEKHDANAHHCKRWGDR